MGEGIKKLALLIVFTGIFLLGAGIAGTGILWMAIVVVENLPTVISLLQTLGLIGAGVLIGVLASFGARKTLT